MRTEPLERPELLDMRATIVIGVSAIVLSVRSFLGWDLSALIVTWEAWPQEPWRLLSSTLLHGGWLHLAFNLYWLLKFGAIVEPSFGLIRAIGIYVLLGLLSSAAQWAFSGSGIGLSGIVYGLFGLLWVLHRYQPGYRAVLDPGVAKLFIVWFFICIVITEMNVMRIANVAHGVGGITGLLLGLCLVPTKFGRWKACFALSLLALVLTCASTFLRPYVNFSDEMVYELNNKAIAALEQEDNMTALGLLERAVALDDENYTAWHNLGVTYYRLGRDEEGSKAFERAEALERRAIEVQRNEGDAGPGSGGLFD